MTELVLHKIYPTMELFIEYINTYSKENFINLAIKDSSKLKDSENKNTEQYKMIEYRCVHWKPEIDNQDTEKISKGTGDRKCQHYNGKACPWVVRCNYQEKTKNYKITNLNYKNNRN